MIYKLSPNFTVKEFACSCCGIVAVERLLIEELEKFRSALGNLPITVLSGYRCPAHNSSVGGAKASQHLNGLAVDIKVSGKTPFELYKLAVNLKWDGLGLAASFLHMDKRGSLARWTYDGIDPQVLKV
jgi:uncharacterized protein YcbK (DUF882 family)